MLKIIKKIKQDKEGEIVKTMRKLFENKKGFTLIEMVITTLILSILMSITMGMITTSGRMFSSTSELAIDKMVGDGVFDALESMAKYATHIEIADSKEMCRSSYDQGFYIKTTDQQENTGVLMYDAKTQKATRYPKQPFSDSFYQGRSIKYFVEPYELSDGSKSGRHLKISVDVYRNGEKVFTRSNVVRGINLGLLGEGDSYNLIESSINEDPQKLKENAYLNFSCDEQLAVSEVNGYEIYSDTSTSMTEYNEINKMLSATLNEILNSDDIVDESERIMLMELAATQARSEIKELFGGFSPANITTDKNSPLRFFNGVVATKEEIFYGTLIKKYSDNGKLSVDTYPDFEDHETFFARSTFTEYGGNMVQLALYIMNTEYGYDSASKTYSPSQIMDCNIYSVRWNDWFLKPETTGMLWWKKTEYNVIDLTNASNSLGRTINGKNSYNNAYTVFHPLRNTWYYQPAYHTIFDDLHNYIWGLDDLPIAYNIGNKSSTAVMMDIDSNIVATYKEIWVGFGSYKYKITEIDTTSDTLWNALPASKIDKRG